ncbi:MAG: class I SAM-dependent methyltransferase [Geobacteraceae bacterium]|nr:class I SAM-dependent methyltransferase [Geobacteraceae bacterium]
MRFLDVLLRDVPEAERVLDAGCGPGAMLHYLGRYGEVTGLDCYPAALEMARSHFAGELFDGDCSSMPFSDGYFSFVFVGEVLYHRNIADLHKVMAECARVLKPGGYLVVVDSAYAACYSHHDRIAHGARRFNKGELVELFHGAGIKVFHSTYAYALLLPVVWIVRYLKKLLKLVGHSGGELSRTWGPVNLMMIWWFTLEASIAGRWGLPFGLSVQVLGRKDAHTAP